MSMCDDAQVHQAQELEGQNLVRRNALTPLDSRWHRHSSFGFVCQGLRFDVFRCFQSFYQIFVVILFGHVWTTCHCWVKTDVPCGNNLVNIGWCWRPPMQQKVPTTVTVTIPRWLSITSVPLKDTRLAKVNDNFEESRSKTASSLLESIGLPKQMRLVDDFRFLCKLLDETSLTRPDTTWHPNEGWCVTDWVTGAGQSERVPCTTSVINGLHDLHAHMIMCTQKEAGWGRCGWYCSHVWPCSLASRWIRQTWRRRGQKKQGWHLAFKSVSFYFINFHHISLASTKCKS